MGYMSENEIATKHSKSQLVKESVEAKTKIILFAGGIGSGKGYHISKKIMELKETGNSILMLSFADPIKRIVKEVVGFDKNGIKVDDRLLLEPKYNDIVEAVGLDANNKSPF
jgi:type II secretory ATPase GspE/PulE/Tfp pilus assembly ATPase PilB-like protein